MPLYDYKCPRCSTVEEHIVSYESRDTATIHCDQCGIPRVREVPKVAPFQFGNTVYPGTTSEAHARKRAQLEKRSAAYDASPQGKEEREATIQRHIDKGNLPRF